MINKLVGTRNAVSLHYVVCVQIIENPDRLSKVKFWFMCRRILIRRPGYFYFNPFQFPRISSM